MDVAGQLSPAECTVVSDELPVNAVAILTGKEMNTSIFVLHSRVAALS
jgi:hypothetical protein